MKTENSQKQAITNIAVFLAKLSAVDVHNRTYTTHYTQCTKERERVEADRKRGALELLEKLEQGAYSPDTGNYTIAALTIAGALGKPYIDLREPYTDQAGLAAMYAYSADVHALAEYVRELEQAAAARPTAGETPGGKLDRLIAELNTAYKASVAAHLQWRAALEEKARAATPADREQWEQLAAARRTVWTAKHQNAMNHIDRLREYSPIAADEWKPPRD